MEKLSRRRPAVSLVLDSSVTLAWIYGDETTHAVRRVFDAVVEDGALAPGLWCLEVANSLTAAVRRRRIGSEFRDAALGDVALPDIAIDPQTDALAWTTTLRLADRFRLTLYDTAYLELAVRMSQPLATLDEDLRAAAGRLGVGLLGIA
jgi:predicted nucleic acid-binding protein